VGMKYFGEHPIGSGPYMFDSQVIGDYMKFKALDYPHWRVGVPKYEYLTYLRVPEETTRIAMLKAGEINATQIGIDKIADVEAAGFNIIPAKLLSVGIVFNQDKADSPFRDERVREALNIAIDREELCQYIFAGQAYPFSLFPASSWSFGYDLVKDSVPAYPYDPERAKELLDEAGYPDCPVDLWVFPMGPLPEGPTMLEAIGGYFEKVGCEVNIIKSDYVAWKTKQRNREGSPYDIASYYTSSARPQQHGLYGSYYAPDGLFGMLGDAYPDNVALWDKILTATNMEELQQYQADLFQYHYDHYLCIPILEVGMTWATDETIPEWNQGRDGDNENLEYLYWQK